MSIFCYIDERIIMPELTKILSTYVAFLRAIYFLHQNNHWKTKGVNFYGNHLLFQRIYESAQENADAAAEKFVGLFGDKCLDLKLQITIMHKILDQCVGDNPVEQSLALEKKFLILSKKLYDEVKSAGAMTLGLDDLILSIASDREEAVYLLQQILKGNE